MQALCIGEMRHGTPASLPSIQMNRHLTFAVNWLQVSRAQTLILLS